jgi:hypothetical protein
MDRHLGPVVKVVDPRSEDLPAARQVGHSVARLVVLQVVIVGIVDRAAIAEALIQDVCFVKWIPMGIK